MAATCVAFYIYGRWLARTEGAELLAFLYTTLEARELPPEPLDGSGPPDSVAGTRED